MDRGRGAPTFTGRGGGGRGAFFQRDGGGGGDRGQGGGRGAGRGNFGGGRGGRGGWRGRGGRRVLNANFMGRGDRGGPSSDAAAETNAKLQQVKAEDALEEGLGFPLFTEGEDRLGWLMTVAQSSMEDKDSGQVVSAVDCFFMCQDGGMFKARVGFAPYFYIQVANEQEADVESWLRRRFEGAVREAEVVQREDLDLKNHLSGLKRRLLKVSFFNVQQLQEVKREVVPIVATNKAKAKTTAAYADLHAGQREGQGGAPPLQDVLDSIVDLREHDVPYHVRFAIDTDVRCGHWFTVKRKDGQTSLEPRPDLLQRAEPRVCAWDIETTKLPLQFPNAEYDQVYMISYMLDKQGYLIVNREVVGEHVHDFEYTPKPEFEGPFVVFNEPNELALLRRFLDHMKQAQPGIYVTYNGDFFDFPFMDKRCAHHGLSLRAEMGFRQMGGLASNQAAGGEWLSRHAVHMDCMHWVNRDSYLPQGSRGLKAVTKAKLGFDPVEVDPEDMMHMAAEQAQRMASYSVSDAVSTYYLYMTYIHPFIFSLATIIPMPPDEVLRKGSGTLCEQLLMVQAFSKGIVCPNKHTTQAETFYKGHLLDSETYIGGKVEAIESGVFRADLPMRFKCKPAAYQGLLDTLDRDLQYALKHEGKMAVEDIVNYDAVRGAIAEKLEGLRNIPNREECPLIYHLDVAAMYPNIILTNRLQPSAIVEDEDCAACDFNRPGKTCLRKMEWVWRGEHFASSHSDFNQVKSQLQADTFPPAAPGEPNRYWEDLSFEEKTKALRDRLKMYTQKVYKRTLDKPVTEQREAGICQRENSFYVDTVRAFRDRRYEYKGANKTWKGKLEAAKSDGDPIRIAEASGMCVLYESLQLAHKCILNSFYGYVMRKGARWYSMEMAGVVTYTGAKIIQLACDLVTQLGRPLELDTDGIWCTLPGSFPETFKFKNKNGKEFKFSYPGVMLNVLVAQHNTNDQYQTLDPKTGTYATSNEMTIEFEVDGPYKAMILPASKEEGKSIKKRYAVFNFDGSLAELKGFEIKRRGELKLIKVFQAEVFEKFLAGETLEGCYGAVAAVANRWLDMLDTQGTDLTDEELIEHISESSVMSKSLEDYEGRKSCAITCAKRLGQFLGDERIKDKGLNCKYVIARRPENQPTSERAIPVSIFSAEPAVARSYLRKWCGDISGGNKSSDQVPDVRDIVDWGYYRERLGSAIQKIITIPAALQQLPNPVPRVRHPDWLYKKVQAMNDKCQQLSLHETLARMKAKQEKQAAEREALGQGAGDGEADRDEDMGEGEEGAGAAGRMDVDGEEDSEEEGCERVAEAADGTEGEVREVRDMEDLGGGGGKKAAGVAERARAAAGQQQEKGDAVAVVTLVGKGNQRKGRGKKHKWRSARQDRKRRWAEQQREQQQRGRQQHQGCGAAGAGAAPPVQVWDRSNVGALLKRRAAAVTAVPWQLVQLAETNTLGMYKMWFLAEGRLQTVHLTVPRTLYIDSSAPAPGELVDRTASTLRVLPGGRKLEPVLQLRLSEPEYRATVPRLSALLSCEQVRAVFEDAMPLAMNAALQLGCVVKVLPDSQRKSLAADWRLEDFEMQSGDSGYLEDEGPDGLGLMRYIALYSSSDAAQLRSVLACVMPAVRKALVVVVAPSAAAREVTTGMLERAWREATAADPGAEPLDQMEFSVDYCQDPVEGARLVQRQMHTWRGSTRAPLLVACQSPLPAARLRQQGLPLLGEFPCVDIPPNADDCRYPLLQWQARAGRRAVARLAQAGTWLRERVLLSRYAAVPLSNLGSDSSVAVADVLMARSLREANHVLWMRDPSLPNLGVEEKDEVDVESLLLLDGAGCGSASSSNEVAAPGAYRSICVELRLHHLAVNAIDKAQQLSELEGAVGPEASGGGLAFQALKGLVERLLADASRRSNPIADHLLQHLYRWVSSPSSQLHHPLLHRAVNALMAKLFAQLVAELRRLGATIVSANFNSIRLCTGKRSIKAAVGYTQYLLSALKRREFFQWLELAPVRWWHALLYRDQYNYGGVEAVVPPDLDLTEGPAAAPPAADGAAPAEEGAEEAPAPAAEAPQEEEPTIRYYWNLKDYLPPRLHEPLALILSEFVYLPWREAQRAAVQGASQGGSQAQVDTAKAEEVQAHYLQHQLMSRFTERLLKTVTEIARVMPAHSTRPEDRFPHLAGSYLTEEELGTPALAYVRTVCHLLALDSRVTDAVAVLRRQLLKLVHVREFGPQAEFKEMCLGFTLPDVICSYCNDCRDLDLCRDDELARRNWHCRVCGQPYHQPALERRLVVALQQRVRQYQCQDLQCVRCKQVAAGHLRTSCSLCSGDLRPTLPAAPFRKHVVVFRNIASYHGFGVLEQLAGWLLDATPGLQPGAELGEEGGS